jgi:glycosyltransferase involved in cell wall biosynthesis
MHIVHIMANNTSVPYFNWFAEEIKQYPEYKFSFVAMHSTSPQMIEDMRIRGCDCYWIPFDCNKRKISMLLAIPSLYKLFKKIRPDVVHTHLFDDSLPGLLAAKLAGVKKRVITKNDTTFHWYYAKKWIWTDRLNNRNATHIAAISNEAKKFIIENEQADIRKVGLIHHGIRIADYLDTNKQYEIDLIEQYSLNNRFVIGTVSRYIEWKGYRYIIEAAKDVVRKYPSVVFLFAGHGEQKKEMEALIAKYGLKENIILTDWIKKEYMPALYKIMDICVHAASLEPFGFIFAEAMTSGIPLVTTSTGAAADALQHKETCFFVNEKNGEELAKGIIWMIENPDKRIQISQKTVKIAEEMYNIKDTVKKYLLFYNKF